MWNIESIVQQVIIKTLESLELPSDITTEITTSGNSIIHTAKTPTNYDNYIYGRLFVLERNWKVRPDDSESLNINISFCRGDNEFKTTVKLWILCSAIDIDISSDYNDNVYTYITTITLKLETSLNV